jgi:NAD(P)-dependent dehydrogenase (short-subunit alcohol dehydrogenase family)
MKNILIIGASSGIGKQLLAQLTNEEYRIFATYNKNEIRQVNTHLSFHKLNVLEKEFDFDYLPETLEGLVYCPGNIDLKPFHRIKPEAFMEDYHLQVLGAIKVTQAVLLRLKKSAHSSIVFFSTVAVQSGYPFHSMVSSSKGAIEGIARALAAELAPKTRVNCIAPSLTDTPLASRLLSSDEKKEVNALRHPLKKIGKPEDIANMAEFLLSDRSAWITGQVIRVDGGISTLKT